MKSPNQNKLRRKSWSSLKESGHNSPRVLFRTTSPRKQEINLELSKRSFVIKQSRLNPLHWIGMRSHLGSQQWIFSRRNEKLNLANTLPRMFVMSRNHLAFSTTLRMTIMTKIQVPSRRLRSSTRSHPRPRSWSKGQQKTMSQLWNPSWKRQPSLYHCLSRLHQRRWSLIARSSPMTRCPRTMRTRSPSLRLTRSAIYPVSFLKMTTNLRRTMTRLSSKTGACTSTTKPRTPRGRYLIILRAPRSGVNLARRTRS